MTLKRNPTKSRWRNTGPTAEVCAVVWDRDCGRCVRCGEQVSGERGIDYSYQHRRRRGAGGTRRKDANLPSNIVLLCGSGTTGCHGHIEQYRHYAAQRGYRVLDGIEPPAKVPIQHAWWGWVLLDDHGDFEVIAE